MKHKPGFLEAVARVMPYVREIEAIDVKALQDAKHDFGFIDVREDDEWREGHAAGAIHIGKGVIERDIEAKVPDKDRELVLYCGGGFRSALAAKAIADMGYTHVRSMRGGIKAWREQRLPEET